MFGRKESLFRPIRKKKQVKIIIAQRRVPIASP
ncbi:MAG: hypothetical protein DDT40_00936 [candidate division WS2 bacterium]|nr:hypothetical protein [Candidatus Psychracetigena formicireducens]MBT9150757.1 hypothetical protein [Candidatus Psychracetigena formicireducens]